MKEDEKKFVEELYMEMTDMLMAVAVKKLSDVLLAEEAVQETFGILCQKVSEVMKHPNPGAWVVSTLSFTIKRMFQQINHSQGLGVRAQQAQLPEETYAPSAESELSLDSLYENLSDKEDFRLLKRFVEEFDSIAAFAAELGISTAACEKRIQRAKRNLGKYFQKS